MSSLNKVLSFSISKQLFNIPTPTSISYFWNFGSLMGICLGIQIASGLFLAMHYESSLDFAFSSVVSICNDVNYGWFIRLVHANGASAFFIFIYFHVFRGVYFGSSSLTSAWTLGVVILLSLMATGFLGYVLPWGQMSFWGATVITNLVSAVPYLGEFLVQWLWGGFSVSGPTLTRFFSLHFLLPFVVSFLVFLHILFLHNTGSSNPLGLSPNTIKVNFHPFFVYKDLLGFMVFFLVFLVFVLEFSDIFMDPDNFSIANPMNTPPHIKPEWYFLFAYAILRSIPNKLGGVIALVMSIIILSLLPMMSLGWPLKKNFGILTKALCWVQLMNFLLLTWIGAMPVESPFELIGQILSFLYFFIFFLIGTLF